MTREKALAKWNTIQISNELLDMWSVSELIDKIYDDFESGRSCSGCKHEPKKGEPYPLPCGECSRWYADGYVPK